MALPSSALREGWPMFENALYGFYAASLFCARQRGRKAALCLLRAERGISWFRDQAEISLSVSRGHRAGGREV